MSINNLNLSLSRGTSAQPSTKTDVADLRIAKLFAQGITLFTEYEPRKNNEKFLKKAEKLYTQAESISRDNERLRKLVDDLKNPTLPDSIITENLKECIPGELMQAIEISLKKASKGGLDHLFKAPRILLQMKNSQGTCIIDHYLNQQQLKIQEIRGLANLYTNAATGTVLSPEEENGIEKRKELQTQRVPFQFNLHYILNENIQETDTVETSREVFKLQQLQDLYTFLNSPGCRKEFILEKYQMLDPEIKTALGKAIWIACYRPNEYPFTDRFLAANPFVLLDCKDVQGTDIIVQLMDHYKTKITLQRFKAELTTFATKLKNTPNKEDQLKLFRRLPQFAQVDLMHLIWLEHGGRKDEKFKQEHYTYAQDQVNGNPLVLNRGEPSILEVYSSTLDNRIKFDIERGVEQFEKERFLPETIIDCSAMRLASDPNLYQKGGIPPNLKVAMIAAEFAGVVNMGGLAPAIDGMARAHGANNVCVILPKYDVINPKLILEEKEKYQIEFNDQTHKVFKTKVSGITCFFVEDSVFNVGYDSKGKPNNIYEGHGKDVNRRDVEVKRRWAHFQSHSAELVYKLSKKEKNPVQLVHIHDAQTALVPEILSVRHFKEWKQGETPPTVFTFHNNNSPLPYDYPEAQALLSEIGLPSNPLNSFIKGLESSDMNTTVSETFAKEVQSKLFGKGMERHAKIHAFNGKIAGIVNGNSNGWNPKTEGQLKNWVTMDGQPLDLTYGPDDKDLPEKIKLIRQQLTEYLKFHGLGDFDPTKPIFYYVGRYDASQKGIDKFPVIMKEAIAKGAQFICIGLDPDEKADRILTEMEKFAKERHNKGVCVIRDSKRPDGRYHWQLGNSAEDLSGVQGFGYLLRAAVDIAVFPSIFEPCGLVQGEMHRMGIETLATSTGGFVDTIFKTGPNKNGYLFARLSNWESKEQDEAIKMAIRATADISHSKLNALYGNDMRRLTPYIEQKRVIMRNAAKSTWTSTFDGSLSPYDRIKLSYAKAFDNRKNRGVISLSVHALGSPTCPMADLKTASARS
ncbi:MAG: glycogen/starch synthase [Rhabdochlamydiaceae bacterium]